MLTILIETLLVLVVLPEFIFGMFIFRGFIANASSSAINLSNFRCPYTGLARPVIAFPRHLDPTEIAGEMIHCRKREGSRQAWCSSKSPFTPFLSFQVETSSFGRRLVACQPTRIYRHCCQNKPMQMRQVTTKRSNPTLVLIALGQW
jgi:hypothetical protein